MLRRVTVVALGAVQKGLLEAAAARAGQAFGLESRFGMGLAEPAYAFNETRQQYHAAAVLRKLAKVRREGELVLGIGAFELFDPDEESVIADGDRDAKTAILGTARLHTDDAARLLERAGHAALIAVGKALGLRECADARCGMASVSHPGNLDKRVGRLCSTCEIAYGKGERAWSR